MKLAPLGALEAQAIMGDVGHAYVCPICVSGPRTEEWAAPDEVLADGTLGCFREEGTALEDLPRAFCQGLRPEDMPNYRAARGGQGMRATPLWWAMEWDSDRVVDLLLGLGAKVELMEVFQACRSIKSPHFFKRLLDNAGLNPFFRGLVAIASEDAADLLHAFLSHPPPGGQDWIRACTAAGEQHQEGQGEGPTLAHLLAFHNAWRCLSVSIKYGIRLEEKEGGRSPIHVALSTMCTEAAQQLVLAGCDVNAVDSEGCTPLHYMVRFMDGWDPSSVSRTGSEPGPRQELLKCILNHGANIECRNTAFMTPLIMARLLAEQMGSAAAEACWVGRMIREFKSTTHASQSAALLLEEEERERRRAEEAKERRRDKKKRGKERKKAKGGEGERESDASSSRGHQQDAGPASFFSADDEFDEAYVAQDLINDAVHDFAAAIFSSQVPPPISEPPPQPGEEKAPSLAVAPPPRAQEKPPKDDEKLSSEAVPLLPFPSAASFRELTLARLHRVSDVDLKSLREEASDMLGRIEKELSFRAEIPDEYLCPITQEIMVDPVIAMDGHTYERRAIEEWLETNNTSPMTNSPLPNKMLLPNLAVRSMISERRVDSR